jgi:hypothetical protein
MLGDTIMTTSKYWRLYCRDELLIGVVCDYPEVFSQEEFDNYKEYIDTNARKTGPYLYGRNDRHDCVTCVTWSMRILLNDDGIRAVKNMEQQMKEMQNLGYANSSIPIVFKDSYGRITSGVTIPDEFLDMSLSDTISQKIGSVEGFYFFGVSIMDGIHSAMVVINNINPEKQMFNIYDQHGSTIDKSKMKYGHNVEEWYLGEDIDKWLLDYVKMWYISENYRQYRSNLKTSVTQIKHNRLY